MHKKVLYIIVMLLVAVSCRKDRPNPAPVVIKPSAVYIVNEGNFGWGNGEISLYDPETKTIENDLFSRNNSYKLGDIAQSISEYNGKYYIVVNNSAKIEVVNKADFKHVSTITGFKSPRFFMAVDASTAYVSDLYENQISVVNLDNNTIVKHIPIFGWTEEMLLYNDAVYVSNIHSDYIYKIDTKTHTLSDSVKVFYGSNSLAKDKDGNIWVASLGDSLKGFKGGITCIASNGKDILKSIPLTSAKQYISDLRINKTSDTLYYINKHIYTLPINSATFLADPIFTSSGNNFYGLGVDPVSSLLYAADAKDYITTGMVYIIDPKSKTAISSFKTGIIPNGFLFK